MHSGVAITVMTRQAAAEFSDVEVDNKLKLEVRSQ
jgi:hypothetical protein